MASHVEIASSFIEGAPPGELRDVVTDIKALTSSGSNIIPSLEPAFRKYNESQLTTVKLAGSNREVIVSAYNKLEDGRYFDVESQTSFEFDHVSQTASAPRSYTLESQNSELIKSYLKLLSSHSREHYPNSSYGVYPSEDDSSIAILLVANKYSPNNFWNGRYRAVYNLKVPSPTTITGTIHVDVHYYEDGNVSLNNKKPVSISIPSASPADTVFKRIVTAEREHQEELNDAFSRLSEGAFKGLRRQLPITRQKVEWENISGYRLGKDISGGTRY
ncbi:F-actin-capping protein subunit alpha [Arthroderma uncinatum]|uniref:F-actin-capping protein subunit alpha n=1 Tax=Arthroderma uncinatum TaxID=74035 RepID=UPI00144A6A59|nr:F-actin-capping protein subunit alpha [Arthroderma uncinatum]KAF3492379.1 F-actin-capping protein subunit alpha [Arthroderma uncinatum]